jgi:hypothetical protein
MQVKGLTNMFCFWISSHELYKEHVLLWFIILKCIWQFEMNQKCLTLNGNCKVNDINIEMYMAIWDEPKMFDLKW